MAKNNKSITPDEKLASVAKKLNTGKLREGAERQADNKAIRGNIVSEAGNVKNTLIDIKRNIKAKEKKEVLASLEGILSAIKAQINELSNAHSDEEVERFQEVYRSLRERLIVLQEALKTVREFTIKNTDGSRVSDLEAAVDNIRSRVTIDIPAEAESSDLPVADTASSDRNDGGSSVKAIEAAPEEERYGDDITIKDGKIFFQDKEIQVGDTIIVKTDDSEYSYSVDAVDPKKGTYDAQEDQWDSPEDLGKLMLRIEKPQAMVSADDGRGKQPDSDQADKKDLPASLETTQTAVDALRLDGAPQVGDIYVWTLNDGTPIFAEVIGAKGNSIVLKDTDSGKPREVSPDGETGWNTGMKADGWIHQATDQELDEREIQRKLDAANLKLKPKLGQTFYVYLTNEKKIVEADVVDCNDTEIVLSDGDDIALYFQDWNTKVGEYTVSKSKDRIQIPNKDTAPDKQKTAQEKQDEIDKEEFKEKPQIGDLYIRIPSNGEPYQLIVTELIEVKTKNGTQKKLRLQKTDGTFEDFDKGFWTRSINKNWLKKGTIAMTPDGIPVGDSALVDTANDTPSPDAAAAADSANDPKVTVDNGPDTSEPTSIETSEEKDYVTFAGRRLFKGDVYLAGKEGTKKQRYEILNADEEKGVLHVKSLDSGGLVIQWTEEMWQSFTPEAETTQAFRFSGKEMLPGQILRFTSKDGVEAYTIVGLAENGSLITTQTTVEPGHVVVGRDGKPQAAPLNKTEKKIWTDAAFNQYATEQLGNGARFDIVDELASTLEEAAIEENNAENKEKKTVPEFRINAEGKPLELGELLRITINGKTNIFRISKFTKLASEDDFRMTLVHTETNHVKEGITLAKWKQAIESGAMTVEKVEKGMGEFKELFDEKIMNQLFVDLATGDDDKATGAFRRLFDSWTDTQKQILGLRVREAGFKNLDHFLMTWHSEMAFKVKDVMARMANEAMSRQVMRDDTYAAFDTAQSRKKEAAQKAGFFGRIARNLPTILVSGGAGAAAGAAVAAATGPAALIGAAAVGIASVAKRFWKRNQLSKERDAYDTQYSSAMERQAEAFANGDEGKSGHLRMAAVMEQMLQMYKENDGNIHNLDDTKIQQAALKRMQTEDKERSVQYRLEAVSAGVNRGTAARYPYAYDSNKNHDKAWSGAMRAMFGGDAMLEGKHAWKGDLLALLGGGAVGASIVMSGGLLAKAAVRFGTGFARAGVEGYAMSGAREGQRKQEALRSLTRTLATGKINESKKKAIEKQLAHLENTNPELFAKDKRVAMAVKQGLVAGSFNALLGAAFDGARYWHQQYYAPLHETRDVPDIPVKSSGNAQSPSELLQHMKEHMQQAGAGSGHAEQLADTAQGSGSSLPEQGAAPVDTHVPEAVDIPEVKAQIANVETVDGDLYNSEGHLLAAKIDMGSGNVKGSEILAMRRLLAQYGITGDAAKPHIMQGLKDFNIKFAGDGGELRQFYTHPGAEMQLSFDADGNPHFSIAADGGEVTNFETLQHFSHGKGEMPADFATKHGIVRADALPEGARKLHLGGDALRKAGVFGATDGQESEVYLKTINGETKLFVENAKGEVFQFDGKQAKGLLQDLAKPEIAAEQAARAAAEQADFHAVTAKGELLSTSNKLPQGLTSANKTGIDFSGNTAYEYWVTEDGANPEVIIRTGSGNVVRTDYESMIGEHKGIMGAGKGEDLRIMPESSYPVGNDGIRDIYDGNQPRDWGNSALQDQVHAETLQKEQIAGAGNVRTATNIDAANDIPVGKDQFSNTDSGAPKPVAPEVVPAAPAPPEPDATAVEPQPDNVVPFPTETQPAAFSYKDAHQLLEDTKVIGRAANDVKLGMLGVTEQDAPNGFDAKAVLGADGYREYGPLFEDIDASIGNFGIISEGGHGVKLMTDGQPQFIYEPRFAFSNGDQMVEAIMPTGEHYQIEGVIPDADGEPVYQLKGSDGRSYLLDQNTDLDSFPASARVLQDRLAA